jgi:hypothetical protein
MPRRKNFTQERRGVRYVRNPNSPLFGGRKRRHAMRAVRSRIRRFLFEGRRRKIGTIVSTCCLVAASGAMAYIVLQGAGSGSQSQQLGSLPNGALTVTVTGVPAGMMPGDCTGGGAVQAWAKNALSQQVHLVGPTKWTATIGGQDATAEFTFQDAGVTQFPKTLSPGDGTTNPINIGDVTMCWQNLPETDQTAELGKTLTVTATAQ